MTKEYRNHKSKYIPNKLVDVKTWQLSRKKFISGIFMASFLASLPSVSLVGNSFNKSDILSENQFSIVTSVQNILFPSDGNGPGAYDVMADRYLIWVLSDKRMDPEEKDYILNGIGWVDETAEENFSKTYNQLSQKEKEKLVADISNESWGSSWLSIILTFIFEALLSDPQYGDNPEEIGWDWLKHNPGHPRPTAYLLYPEILTTVSKNTEE